MSGFALSLTIIGAAYILWFLFVLALVSSLNEIKKTTWHYKFYSVLRPYGNPKNSCDYGKILTFAPLFFAFLVSVVAMLSILVVIRFIFNWIIWPFFTGKIPAKGLSKGYFRDLVNLDTTPGNIGDSGIPTKKFMRLSPLLWLLIFIFVSAASFETYRVITGSATKLEINILLITAGICVLILAATWASIKPSVKTMYAIAKQKLCRNLPVTE